MYSTDVIYEVAAFSVGDTKAGTKMGKLQLKNTEDKTILNCVLWEETLNRFDAKIFRCGNLVKIISASFNEKYNNCLISVLELVKEAKTGLDENEREKYYAALVDCINEIKDEKLQSFVAKYFMEHSDKIKVSPAAKVMHHNYIGGLMVHTLEVVNFAKLNLPHFVYKLNKDEIIAACLLHDIGKIYEYKINTEDGLIEYDEEFKKDWISHTQYGFCLCMNEGFKNVAKMIAAHHGRSEWGAIIDLDQKDIDNDLYLINIVDNLSAKFGKINVSMLEKKEENLG
ncbi:MAG: HD domain-containing protein [Clostridiaceae bacterium]|jgi:putative nucleotidyltransferase with HDIG domain|nr:HD domain-containing protein [Clostridiaceae bacterium]